MSSLYKRQISAASEMRLAKRVVHGTSPSVLRSWNQPGVAFAEWTRSWEPSLIGRLDGLALDDLPRARFIARLDRIGDDVASVISQAGNCDATVVAALGSDIESLATRFAQATAARRIEVRLEAICDDACRLFHIDRMKARLVTTYIGPGTEWVHTAHEADALGNAEGFAGPVQQLPRFSVALFPGSLSPAGGLVHRSPRLAGAGKFRLFLCLNEAR